MLSLHDANRDLRRAMGMPLLAFLGLGVAVGMLGDLLLDARPLLPWVDGTLDLASWLTHLGLTIGLFAVGWAGATRWLRRLGSRQRVHDIITGEDARPCRWLVFPASVTRDDAPGIEAPILDHHAAHGRLERVFVLHTTGDDGVRAWERVRKACATRGLVAEPVALQPEAADDPEPVFDAVEALYARATADGLDDPDVLLDYTGGTKHFTAGLVLAGAQHGRRLQTLKPRKRTDAGYADRSAGSRCVEVDLRFEVRGLLPPVD